VFASLSDHQRIGICAYADTRTHIRSGKENAVKTVFHCCDKISLAKIHKYKAVSSLKSPVTDRTRSPPTGDGKCVEVPALSCSDNGIVSIVHRVSRHLGISSLTGRATQ
jgi:hypothetical protein